MCQVTTEPYKAYNYTREKIKHSFSSSSGDISLIEYGTAVPPICLQRSPVVESVMCAQILSQLARWLTPRPGIVDCEKLRMSAICAVALLRSAVFTGFARLLTRFRLPLQARRTTGYSSFTLRIS